MHDTLFKNANFNKLNKLLHKSDKQLSVTNQGLTSFINIYTHTKILKFLNLDFLAKIYQNLGEGSLQEDR